MDELRYNNMINVRKEKTYKIIQRDLEMYIQYRDYLIDKIKITGDTDRITLQELFDTTRTINTLKSILNEAEKI